MVLTMRAGLYGHCARPHARRRPCPTTRTWCRPWTKPSCARPSLVRRSCGARSSSRAWWDDLVHDVRGQTGALPLLQHTLHGLWRALRSGRRLAHAAYGELGRLDGALQRRAEEMFAAVCGRRTGPLPPHLPAADPARDAARRTPERRVAARELLTAAGGRQGDGGGARAAGRRAAGDHERHGRSGGERTVEAAHEALIRSSGPAPPVDHFTAASCCFARARWAKPRVWQDNAHDPSCLYPRPARSWSRPTELSPTNRTMDLTPLEQQFLDATA